MTGRWFVLQRYWVYPGLDIGGTTGLAKSRRLHGTFVLVVAHESFYSSAQLIYSIWYTDSAVSAISQQPSIFLPGPFLVQMARAI